MCETLLITAEFVADFAVKFSVFVHFYEVYSLLVFCEYFIRVYNGTVHLILVLSVVWFVLYTKFSEREVYMPNAYKLQQKINECM